MYELCMYEKHKFHVHVILGMKVIGNSLKFHDT